MKFRLLLATVLACTLFISSCTKEEDSTPSATADTPTYPVEGLWLGTYSVTTVPSQGNLFYSFAIYPDGTILTKSLASDGKYYYSTGTWTWQSSASNVFVATISTMNTPLPIVQRITATWSKTGIMTDGVWTDTSNPYNAGFSGKFSTMQRIN
ncbi:MAG: hypothetical protein INR73_17800 [Williamsia sp.]|nr:hypothetical protein [Williamsia sp.]